MLNEAPSSREQTWKWIICMDLALRFVNVLTWSLARCAGCKSGVDLYSQRGHARPSQDQDPVMASSLAILDLDWFNPLLHPLCHHALNIATLAPLAAPRSFITAPGPAPHGQDSKRPEEKRSMLFSMQFNASTKCNTVFAKPDHNTLYPQRSTL